MILKEKLFDKYPIEIELDREIIIIHGKNGTGKTKVLEMVYRHFLDKGKNVIHFPEERYFNLDVEDIEQIACEKAVQKALFSVNNILDLDNFSWERERERKYLPKKNEFIKSGNHQLLHMYCNIIKNKSEIVLIDLPERSLHITNQQKLMDDILGMDHVKQLIIVTHSPSIVRNNMNELCDINDLIKGA